MIIVVGPLPPPIHGIGVVTEQMLNKFRALPGTSLRVISTSVAKLERSIWTILGKFIKVTTALLIVAAQRSRGVKILYLAADGGLGMVYTSLLALVGRMRGFKLFIHHHSSDHLDHKRWRMTLLALCAGRMAVHILLCTWAGKRIAEFYPGVKHVFVLSNAFIGCERGRIKGKAGVELSLGHLSNLSHQKGLDTAIATLRGLRREGVSARLILAGPLSDRSAEGTVRQAQEEFGELIEYRGPVDPEGKRAFFHDVDVLVFPTRYRFELESLVVLEALAAGVPVVAYARGCIGTDLSRGGGVAVSPSQSFVETSVPVLREMAISAERRQEAARLAMRRFEELHDIASTDLEKFLALVAAT